MPPGQMPNYPMPGQNPPGMMYQPPGLYQNNGFMPINPAQGQDPNNPNNPNMIREFLKFLKSVNLISQTNFSDFNARPISNASTADDDAPTWPRSANARYVPAASGHAATTSWNDAQSANEPTIASNSANSASSANAAASSSRAAPADTATSTSSSSPTNPARTNASTTS